VAFRAGRPVGIMGLMRQGSSKMAHRANLVMVYVRESERGTGAAKAMLDAALDHAKRSGIRQVELAANAENKAALGFYRREGFREIGTIPAGFIHEGEEVDEVLMVRRLV
jgi:ribosomal protein S18 acetylase RimI-like enzyme